MEEVKLSFQSEILLKNKKQLVVIEGTNGSGKTTLCNALGLHYKINNIRGIPDYMDCDVKNKILKYESFEVAILYFFAGLIAQTNYILNANETFFITDRWVWSTLVAHYAFGGQEHYDRCLEILYSLKQKILMPSVTICLSANQQTLISRIAKRAGIIKELDELMLNQKIQQDEMIAYKNLSYPTNVKEDVSRFLTQIEMTTKRVM